MSLLGPPPAQLAPLPRAFCLALDALLLAPVRGYDARVLRPEFA